MAIWLGFILLIVGLLIFIPRPPENMAENIAKHNEIMKAEAAKAPFKTIAWYKAANAKKGIKALDGPIGKTLQKFLNPPGDWKINPLDAIYRNQAQADALNMTGKETFEKVKAAEAAALTKAQAAETIAAAAGFSDIALNAQAETDIADWVTAQGKISKAKAKANNKPFNRIPYLIGLGAVMAIFFGIGKRDHGPILRPILRGFFLCLLHRRAGLHG